MIEKIAKQLVNENLSGVTFVCDYLQLQFNPPPVINVYSKCEVGIGNDLHVFGDELFANAIISCIGKNVAEVRENKERQTIEIKLDGGVSIVLHYSNGTFDPPEAIEYSGPNELCVIWP